MNDETTGPGERDATPGEQTEAGERVAFCQQCGTGLTSATVRRVGPAVYCEPCLIARLGDAGAGTAAGQRAGQRAGQGAGQGAAGAGWTPVSGAVPPAGAAGDPAGPRVGGPGVNEPSPGLAAFLGLIPGVGAMYNGQYAKGVAHLVIFAILDSLSKNVNDVFGLLVLGWIVYQVFDAYHTAKARRDGMPLPNPFGLNDIGDRMGFGRNWPGSAARPVTSSTTAGWASAAGPGATTGASAGTAAQGVPPRPGWSGYVPPTNFGATAPPPPPPPAAGQPAAYSETGAAGAAGSATAPGTAWAQAPYANPYVGEAWQAPVGAPVPPMPPGRRFPVGAAWLIALGLIFLLANLNASWRLSGSWITAIVLGALGSYLLFRRVETVRAWSMATGESDDARGGFAPRLMCQIRGPVMLLVLALLFALQAAGVRTLGQTWAVLLIALGVLLILERMGARSSWYAAGTGVPAAETRKDGR